MRACGVAPAVQEHQGLRLGLTLRGDATWRCRVGPYCRLLLLRRSDASYTNDPGAYAGCPASDRLLAARAEHNLVPGRNARTLWPARLALGCAGFRELAGNGGAVVGPGSRTPRVIAQQLVQASATGGIDAFGRSS